MTDDIKLSKLRYDEGCLAAHALNIIGDRWALLVMRELIFKAKRFQAIRAGLPGVSPAVLTQRLTELVAAGVIAHDDEFGSYQLTEPGKALKPVLVALCEWGTALPGHDPRRFISPTALMISMSCKVDHVAVKASRVVAGIDAGRETFTLKFDRRGDLDVTPALGDQRDFTLSGDGNALARAVYGRETIAALVKKGVIDVDGDKRAAQAFVDVFHYRREA